MATSLNRTALSSYGILAMPLAFVGVPLYIHAPDFYATTYGVSLSTLAIILLLLRLVDAMSDPLIGLLSDRYALYRPAIMLCFAVFLVASFTLLFLPLNFPPSLWFAACIFVATTAFSLLTINLNTLGGLWRKETHEKTTIASYREAFGLVGLLSAVILPSILQHSFRKDQAFLLTALILAVMMCLALWRYYRWYSLYHHTVNAERTVTQSICLSDIVNIPPDMRRFYVIYAISMLASSIPAVLVLFFIRDRLYLENYTGLFLLTYFSCAILAIPIWRYISKRYHKYYAWLGAMILAVASFIWAYALEAGDFWQYLCICIFSGMAFGAELVLPTSLLADYIHTHHKEKHASLYYGILAFLLKGSLALATLLSLSLLDNAGFTPDAWNHTNALHRLSFTYAAIPCVMKCIAMYLLWRITHENNHNIYPRRNHHA